MSRRTPGKLPSVVPSAYAGGYSESIRRQLESVVLPEKIKCKTCNKYRSQNAYSKRQLDILCNAVVVQGSRALTSGHAKCRVCVGGQTVELKCCICDQVKSLDEFAKNQRQQHEFARCLNCVQGHADAEPVLEEHKLLVESEMSSVHETTMTMSQLDDMSLGASARRLAISDAPHHPYDDGDQEDDDDLSVGGGVWVEPERMDENSKGKGVDPTGSYSLHGKPRLFANCDSPSVHGGWVSWGITENTPKMSPGSVQSSTPPTKNRTSKFARVPGKRFEKKETLAARLLQPVQANPTSDDDDEEDEGVENFL